MVLTYSKSMDQPGKVANPARGQLNREINTSLSTFAPENIVSRDGFGCPVPRQPARSPCSRLHRLLTGFLPTICMYLCIVVTCRLLWINRVRLPILLVVS